MSARCDVRLVQNALHMALSQRQLQGNLLHHSDRGSQYAAYAYQDLLAQHRITVSMSRTANCYDNAVMESFFRTLKSECVDWHVFSLVPMPVRLCLSSWRSITIVNVYIPL